MITFIHTADVHIGAPFTSLGKKGSEHRKQIKDTFSRVIDLAIEKEVSLLLIAGDLFDSNTVSKTDFECVTYELKRLIKKDIIVVVIGGNHDFLGDNSVYTDSFFKNTPGVTVLSKEKPYEVFDHLDVTIYGASCYSNKSTKSPFEALSKEDTGTRHAIALIHGSHAIPDKHAPDDYPFTSEEIDGSEFDYIASGNWHSYYEVPTEKIEAINPGSPEALGFDQKGAGSVVYGEIEGDDLKTEKVQVGSRQFASLDLDVTAHDDVYGYVLGQIRDNADADTVLDVTLTGVLSPDTLVSSKKIEEEFGADFFMLKVTDKTQLALDALSLDDFPEELIVGQFVRIMIEKIQDEPDDAQKMVLEKALQVGIHELQGREV